MEQKEDLSDRIWIEKGDITQLRFKVGAIVNAANSSLMGGGGVDGAIHRAGGPDIIRECSMIIEEDGPCPTGQAVITAAGNLQARFVIHAVGPVWQGGKNNEALDLTNCYRNSLLISRKYMLRRIAFPNISTGAYKYPKDEAAAIAVHTTIDFLLENEYPLAVIFCCFDDENYNWTKYYLDNYLKQA